LQDDACLLAVAVDPPGTVQWEWASDTDFVGSLEESKELTFSSFQNLFLFKSRLVFALTLIFRYVMATIGIGKE
jgi:hypothetical protein